jgi:hypothetical protein
LETDRNVGKRKKTHRNIGKQTIPFSSNMSRRGGRSSGGGGRGNNDRGGRGRGRGQNYSGTSKASKRGLCTTLGNNVFNYGHKAAADQIQTSWENLVQYDGTKYRQDISNELQNKVYVILAKPVRSPAVMARHAIREQLICTGQADLQQAHLAQHSILEAAVTAAVDPEAPMKLAVLDNAIAEGDFKQNVEVPINMSDSEKKQYSNEWRSYRERNGRATIKA